MNRKKDLQQFFICANSSQDRHDFDLDNFTEQYLQRNPNKLLFLYGVVKRFINNKWLKGLGLAIIFMVILALINKHLFTIPDFTCGWISCIGFYLGKDGL